MASTGDAAALGPDGVVDFDSGAAASLPSPAASAAIIDHRQQTYPMADWHSQTSIARPSIRATRDISTGLWYIAMTLVGFAGALTEGGAALGTNIANAYPHVSI